MRMLLLFIAAITFCSNAALADSPLQRKNPQTPNIILIFADDLGWKDVGYQNGRTDLTPNLDNLARQGMIFTDAYATAGNCAPSRACLLSGLYTPRHGLYAVGSTDRGPKDLMRLDPVPNRNGLASSFVTIAEALQQAGYATGHFGKWHLAGPDGAKPSEQGFQVTFDSFGNGIEVEGSEGNKKGPPEDPKGVFTLTRKACDFITTNQHQPFFVYLSHHAIHTPLQSRLQSREKFADQKGKQPSANYLACTHDLDASVGMLIEHLHALKLAENTLVIFTSDNGATPQSPQEPLRGNKGGYYEGGIREPFIAYWPGVIAAGSTSAIPISNVDLYPTFIDYAAAAEPANTTLDGESLRPLFEQTGDLKRQSIYWHFPGYLDRPVIRGRDAVFRTRPVSVIRQGDWKLLLYHEEWLLDGGREQLDTNRAVELYNLREDIGETKDLSLTQPERRDELLTDLLDWLQKTSAPLPTPLESTQ